MVTFIEQAENPILGALVANMVFGQSPDYIPLQKKALTKLQSKYPNNESAIAGNLGFDIETDSNFRKDAYLFGESQSRCVITINPQKEDNLVNFLNTHNVPFSRIGEVVKQDIRIDSESFGKIEEYIHIFNQTLSQKMAGDQN